MKIGHVVVTAVADLVAGTIAWMGRDFEASRYVTREILERHHGAPRVVAAASVITDITTADLVAGEADNPWTPQLDRLVICGLPSSHELWWPFAVFINRRWDDLWDVKSGSYQVDRDGVPANVPRDSDWDPYLMDLATAENVALHRARTVTRGGRTADQILQEERCQIPAAVTTSPGTSTLPPSTP